MRLNVKSRVATPEELVNERAVILQVSTEQDRYDGARVKNETSFELVGWKEKTSYSSLIDPGPQNDRGENGLRTKDKLVLFDSPPLPPV